MDSSLVQNLEITGFCWYCGKVCEGKFCNVKHQILYERKIDAQVLKGKRAGYGLKGSCH